MRRQYDGMGWLIEESSRHVTRLQVAAQAQFDCLVLITSSRPSPSSGTKPQPPHVGHCCSSSMPFSATPSPLQSGQVFMCAPRGMRTKGPAMWAGLSTHTHTSHSAENNQRRSVGVFRQRKEAPSVEILSTNGIRVCSKLTIFQNS